MTIRDIAIAFGYEVDKDSEKKANESINALKSKAGKILGAIGIGFSLSQINALVEQYGAINQRLKSTTGELANQKELQDQIMQTASNTLTSYEITANAVASYVSQSKKVLKTSESALHFTELTTKAWKAAGKQEAEIASLHGVLASAFQKNIIDAGTFETLLAQTPETIGYLEKSLGKSRTQLRAMAQAGVLTASHLTQAFTKSADEINAAYANAPMRITDALRVAKEKVALILTQTDEGMEVTKTISKMILKGTDFLVSGLKKITELIKKLTFNLGGTENTLKILGISAAVVFGMKGVASVKKFISSIGGIGKVLNPVTLKIALIAAAIVLLILIIEDIVAFCQGRDSLFGEMLKKTGMDVEGTRKQLLDAWNEIKTALTEAFTSLKQMAGELGKAFSEFWSKHGEKIMKFLTLTVKSVVTAVATILKVAGQLLTFITKLLSGDTEGAFQSLVDALETLFTGLFQHWKEVIDSWLAFFGTSLSDIWNSLVEWLTNVKNSIVEGFNNIVDWFKKNWSALLLLLINPFAGALKLLYNNNEKFRNAVDGLLNKIKNKFGEMKGKLKNKVSEWKSGIENGFATVKEWFESLPSKALQWGKDFLQNFIDGIMKKFPWLEKAIGFVTNLISGNLEHSVPDEGPLRDDDKWMPDFMDNLTNGLRKGLPALRSAVSEIAAELLTIVNPEPTPVTQNIAYGSSATRVVNQYNNWTNHFNGGTKQEQADLARSTDSQARTASSKLGTELAYTR